MDSPFKSGIFRSTFSLSILDAGSAELDACAAMLKQYAGQAPEMFKGQPLVLDLTHAPKLPEAADFKALQQLALQQYGINLIGVSGITDLDQAENLRARGIVLVNSNRFAKKMELQLLKPVEVKVPVEVPVEVKVPTPVPLKVIKRNIHSGEIIEAHDNSLVLFGSLGPGARLIASHHVMIIGNVRGGEIFAGAPAGSEDHGMTSAFITVSGTFDPNVISISGNYQTADDLSRNSQAASIIKAKSGICVTLHQQQLIYAKLNASDPLSMFKDMQNKDKIHG